MSPSLPLPKLKPGGSDRLDELLHRTVASKGFPAIFYLATNVKETIYSNQDGDMVFGDESSGKVDVETTMELFSMTKLVTAVSTLQLVEKGMVSLDDPADIEKHLPEVAGLKVLTGYDGDEPILEDVKTKITLRMLMSHTAGLVYAVQAPDSPHAKYLAANPRHSIFSPLTNIDSLTIPLLYQPGTSWFYSVSLDWAGKLVERVSGLQLDEYFQKNVFDKVEGGMKSMSFFPTKEIKEKKMRMCTRDMEGKVVAITTYGFGRPSEEDEVSRELLLGGAGLFGTLKDYLAFLRAILRCDPRYETTDHHRLISKESYAELFTGSVPLEGGNGRQSLAERLKPAGYLIPEPKPETVNHSVGCCLTLVDSTDARKAGSAFWSGVAKTQWWIDPKTGIAAICGTQLLVATPSDPWFQAYSEYERCLYANLQ